MRKSDGVRVYHKKERWGESYHERKSAGVRVDNEKRAIG